MRTCNAQADLLSVNRILKIKCSFFYRKKIHLKITSGFFSEVSKNSVFRKIQHVLGSRTLCQFVDVNPPESQSQYTHAQGMICDKLSTPNPLSETLTPLDRHCPTVMEGVKTPSLLSNCKQDLCRDCTEVSDGFCVCVSARVRTVLTVSCFPRACCVLETMKGCCELNIITLLKTCVTPAGF